MVKCAIIAGYRKTTIISHEKHHFSYSKNIHELLIVDIMVKELCVWLLQVRTAWVWEAATLDHYS